MQRAPQDWHLQCVSGDLVLSHPNLPPFRLSPRTIQGRLRQARQSDLFKACGATRGISVLDMFGGWGIDGFILCSLGCDVTILEKVPIVATLAQELAYQLELNPTLVCVDSEEFLAQTKRQYDVVYFDPMFSPHPTTAKPQRRMQILEVIGAPTDNFPQIFEQARHRANDRVVIKNRRHQRLIDQPPSWELQGRTVRFDVYKTQY